MPSAAPTSSPPPAPTPARAGPAAAKGVSQWQDAWRRLRKNRMAMFGLVVILVMGALSALAPWLAPFDATDRKSTRLNSSHNVPSRMPSSA